MISAERTNGSRSKRRSVLIVEDNVSLATCLEMLLEAHDYEVYRTIDGTGGLQSIKLMDFDIVLCDLIMPGLTGDLLHSAVRLFKPYLCDRFIFMSGHPDKEKWSGLPTCAGRPIFWKPFPVSELLAAIEQVLQENACRPNTRQLQSAPV
jgi:DNA-binding response OmpR family regulator